MQTPIERIYPELWDEEHATVNKNQVFSSTHLQTLPFYKEPHENAVSVIRTLASKFQKVPTSPKSPPQKHSLSEQGIHSCTVMIPLNSLTLENKPKFIVHKTTGTNGSNLPTKRFVVLLDSLCGHHLSSYPIVAHNSPPPRYTTCHI